MSGAGRDLAGDVGEHDVGRHDAELPLVHRDDRAMAAQVLAAAAGLGGPDDSPRAVRHVKRGVSIQREQPAAIRNEKMKPRDRGTLVVRQAHHERCLSGTCGGPELILGASRLLGLLPILSVSKDARGNRRQTPLRIRHPAHRPRQSSEAMGALSGAYSP